MSLFADFPAAVPVLRGELVRLEPLSSRHGADLAVAAEEDHGSYGFTGVPRASEMSGYLTDRFERAKNGGMAPFAQVRLGDGRAVEVDSFVEPPTVGIDLPVTLFLRLTGGRADIGPDRGGEIHFTGDRQLGEQLVANLAFTI